jgi:KaiC/GvpD/RAD55 family RecA-like ATPase
MTLEDVLGEPEENDGGIDRELGGHSSFGIADIDELLGGGLIPGKSYLFETEPGTEELAFVASFLDAGWHEQELCVVITSDVPNKELIKRLSQFVDVKEKIDSGSLMIVDLFTDAKDDSDLSGPIYMTPNPRDFNTVRRLSYELADRTPQALEHGMFRGIRYATYSLSSMTKTYRFEPMYKWLEAGLDLARQYNMITLSLLEPKMFDETTVAAFEHLHDGVIALSMEKLGDRFQRYIRVKQSPMSVFSTKIVVYDVINNRPHLQKQPD